MHACGHAICNMTTALGLLDQMLQVQPKNNMPPLPAGAGRKVGSWWYASMYEDGAFGDWLGCQDEFHGLHVRPDSVVGDIR